MTNREKINSMTDNELCNFLAGVMYFNAPIVPKDIRELKNIPKFRLPSMKGQSFLCCEVKSLHEWLKDECPQDKTLGPR